MNACSNKNVIFCLSPWGKQLMIYANTHTHTTDCTSANRSSFSQEMWVVTKNEWLFLIISEIFQTCTQDFAYSYLNLCKKVFVCALSVTHHQMQSLQSSQPSLLKVDFAIIAKILSYSPYQRQGLCFNFKTQVVASVQASICPDEVSLKTLTSTIKV